MVSKDSRKCWTTVRIRSLEGLSVEDPVGLERLISGYFYEGDNKSENSKPTIIRKYTGVKVS